MKPRQKLRLAVVVIDLLLVLCLAVALSRFLARRVEDPIPGFDPREVAIGVKARDTSLARSGASLERPPRAPEPAPPRAPAPPNVRLISCARDASGAASVVLEDASGQHFVALGDPAPERYALEAVTERGATVLDTPSRAKLVLAFED
jgi:hypothetical protein